MRAIQARLVDRTKDLNPLENGFVSAVLDSASFTCTPIQVRGRTAFRWAVRLTTRNANFAVALRMMTGVGEFVEVAKRKLVLWSLGAVDASFLLPRILEHLQLHHRQAELLLRYRRDTLIGRSGSSYPEEMRSLNEAPVFRHGEMDDVTFLGYFLGLFEIRADVTLLHDGPLLALRCPLEALAKQIRERIGGTNEGATTFWAGWTEFNGIYELTKDRLFCLRETMNAVKGFEEGRLKLEEIRRIARQRTGRQKRIDVRALLPKLDELAQKLKGLDKNAPCVVK